MHARFRYQGDFTLDREGDMLVGDPWSVDDAVRRCVREVESMDRSFKGEIAWRT